DREMGEIIKSKLDQQLYEVTIRLLVSSPDDATHYSRMNALVESFKPFRTTYQAIGTRQSVPWLAPRGKRLEQFKARALSPHHISQQTVLSSSELADLYHFPNTDMTKTEGLVKSRSRELAAPLSIKRSDAKLDVVIGVNKHGGDLQEIGMTLEQRQKHTYIIGKTGTGKTTMLKASIYQDMISGKGLAVLDPHGDMFHELLAIIPEHRREDVVVFDPSDDEYPVGLNILDPGIEFANEDMKHARITSTVLSVFKKLADDNQWGPRMEHILRNTTLTALQLPNPSLYTLQRLLTDKKYQREVAKTIKDPVLKQFWDKEFKLLGSMQMSTVTAPLTHRLGHFITTKMSRHILLQEKSTIRIADIMNEGKILLINLSKGDIGEDQSLFFGTILTSFIWMAAYQRTKIPEKQRRDFFVYVDEFQNFATPQFSEIMSEGRKYHVALILSHQNIAQIEDKSIVKIVASNASTLICLKVGPEDETFILPYMKPEVESGDIVNLAPYNFYMKTTADESEDAFSGQTVPLDVEESEVIAKKVVAQSRKQYSAPKAKVEKQMEELFTAEEPKKKPRSKTETPKISDTPSKPTAEKGVHGA
ncbi:MAG TPA: type IV secretion system DNA-binding domain-containing protein, partial [Candidatus Saccharimonadales bacterium]|nr:type IV secretion system DNA-binding domain-containing protein [Candidatus Saccharimonadales bacterium]